MLEIGLSIGLLANLCLCSGNFKPSANGTRPNDFEYSKLLMTVSREPTLYLYLYHDFMNL